MKECIFKFYHQYIKHDDLFLNYDFVNKFQYATSAEINKFQQEALTKLLFHSFSNVLYYKKSLNDFSFSFRPDCFLEQFSKIPFLTKEIIRENYNDLQATNLPKNRFLKNSTSGSTGSNLIFFSDKNAIIRQALGLRCNDWMGKKFDERELKIWGASWDVNLANKFIPNIKSKLKSTLVVSGYMLSDENLKKYVELISSYRPYLLTSYPSILYAFAKYIKENNLSVHVNAIKSAGEKLHGFQLELIESVFKCKVYNFYGARDIPMIAMQCGCDNGLHLMAENVYLEVIDDKGNAIQEGEGNIVITDLHNYAFPFIRYVIGDRARISKRECSCGRGLPIIDEIIGRKFDIIQFANGNKVGGTFWTLLLRSVPGIMDFQVVQIDFNTILINYVEESLTNKPDLRKIESRIREFAGDGVKITFRLVKFIPPNKAGKRQFVISNQ